MFYKEKGTSVYFQYPQRIVIKISSTNYLSVSMHIAEEYFNESKGIRRKYTY